MFGEMVGVLVGSGGPQLAVVGPTRAHQTQLGKLRKPKLLFCSFFFFFSPPGLSPSAPHDEVMHVRRVVRRNLQTRARETRATEAQYKETGPLPATEEQWPGARSASRCSSARRCRGLDAKRKQC